MSFHPACENRKRHGGFDVLGKLVPGRNGRDDEREKRKGGKEEYLYSAFIQRFSLKTLRHGSHSFTCKLHHACFYFVSVHQMAPPLNVVANIYLQLTTHLSTREDERLSWPRSWSPIEERLVAWMINKDDVAERRYFWPDTSSTRRMSDAFTPAEAGTRFSDPGEMQGWVDLGGGYIPR